MLLLADAQRLCTLSSLVPSKAIGFIATIGMQRAQVRALRLIDRARNGDELQFSVSTLAE